MPRGSHSKILEVFLLEQNVSLILVSCTHFKSSPNLIRAKTPLLHNGSNTYKLTHTRFLNSVAGQTGSQMWSYYPSIDESRHGVDPETSKPGNIPGLSRDKPLAAQIVQFIGNDGWEKRVSDPISSEINPRHCTLLWWRTPTGFQLNPLLKRRIFQSPRLRLGPPRG